MWDTQESNLSLEESSLEDNLSEKPLTPLIELALRDTVFAGQYEQIHQPIRQAILNLQAIPEADVTHAHRARKGYEQLRKILAELGPAQEIARDLPQLFSLFDWAAIGAPDLLAALSGHFNLTIGAIQRLGTNSIQQQQYLESLDSASHVGVFLLTELGYGSNVLELETEAKWDQSKRQFLLNTPHGAASKFMPNVADNAIAKTTIVAARLKIDGVDEGIFPFIVPLRTSDGLTKNIDVSALPAKGYGPMDNAMIRFNDVPLPYEAWLPAGIASIDEQGHFVCQVPLRDRFHRTIEQLQSGRIALSAATVSAARAGLWLAVRYATQRRTAGGVMMIDRDNVQRDLVSNAANVYATTALANMVQTSFADPTADPRRNAVLAMLAKPLLSSTALSVLQNCRERCGAQGMFVANLIPNYIGATQGIVTAEGDNQVLQVAAGRLLGRQGTTWLTINDSPDEPPWWHELLNDREQALASAGDNTFQGSTANGPNSHAMDLAQAVADRLAVDCLTQAATTAHNAFAGELLHNLAAVYALEKIQRNALWYTATKRLSADQAEAVAHQLSQRYQTLTPHLSTLVNAFAIPPGLLNAPIAADDYIHAWLQRAGWQEMAR